MPDARADAPPPGLAMLIGADSLLGPRSGIGRMTLEVAMAARTHPGIADLGLLIRGGIHPASWLDAMLAAPGDRAEPPPPPGLVGRLKRRLGDHVPLVNAAHQARERLRLRRRLRDNARSLRAASPLPLVYHEPNMITRPFDGPTVVTVNDLSWFHEPDLHPRERIRWINRNLRRSLAGATRFVAISGFTRDEMARHLHVDPARVDVAHLAPAPEFRPVAAGDAALVLARHGLADRSYVLSVSTIEPRKNFDRLLTAYLGLPASLRARMTLAIAGGKGWGAALKRPEAERAVAAGELRLLGFLPDGDLVTLTARCAAFAYVSLYEGFGLPVIEAMATGVPVLASATSAVGETAGDAGLLVDPLDEGAIREGLRRLIEDPAEAADRRAASLRRAAGFTWRATVDAMAATWRAAATA